MLSKSSPQMTVVYDNQPFNHDLQPDWGFSCLIKGLEKAILFDTGTNVPLLLTNMKKLGINPQQIKVIFLSHVHKDHTGGLDSLLDKITKVEVWMPSFFPPDLKKSVKNKGSQVVEIDNFQKIEESAYTTGIIQGWIKEQSLVLDTPQGLIVITGCAHPRIIHILSTVKNLIKKDIYLALGGFHLAGFEEDELKEIIEKFREFGVKKVGPSHCTGHEACRLFAQKYKNNFIQSGLGKRIEIP